MERERDLGFDAPTITNIENYDPVSLKYTSVHRELNQR